MKFGNKTITFLSKQMHPDNDKGVSIGVQLSCLIDQQQYALSIDDGHIEALSEDAKNPVPYFINLLSSEYDGERAETSLALRVLNDKAAIPALEKAIAVETHEAVKQDLEISYKKVKNGGIIAGNALTRSGQDTVIVPVFLI